ncbi:MAG: hypothetical protein GY851_35235 [bacterium]|nr:hypothetical protein [bacterium]
MPKCTKPKCRTAVLWSVVVSVTAIFLAMGGVAIAAETVVSNPTEATAACEQSKPGDTVILRDGVYTDQRFAVQAIGTPDEPVIFRAETPGGVTLTGKTDLTVSGSHVTVDGMVFDQAWDGTSVRLKGATECRLTNCAFIECGSPTSAYPHIITLTGGSRRNRVDHCYMQANLSIGMGVCVRTNDYENTHNRFDHCYFKDIVRRSGNGQEAVQIGQGGLSDRTSQHAVVEYNLFDNASGDSEIVSNKTCHNTIRFNTFRNCDAMLVLRGGSNARVEGNFVFNGAGGIRVHDGFHVIVNNHIENCKTYGISMPCGTGDHEFTYYGPVNNCVVAHNTIVNCGGAGIHVGQPQTFAKAKWQAIPTGNDFIKNLVVSDRGQLVKDDGSRTTLWRGNVAWATGDAEWGLEHEGILRVDPRLELRDGMSRLPGASSPASNLDSADFRNLDAPIPGADVDMDGQPRDEKTDAGADEVSDASVQRHPLEPGDVGPVWMKGDPGVVRRIASPKPIPALKKR